MNNKNQLSPFISKIEYFSNTLLFMIITIIVILFVLLYIDIKYGVDITQIEKIINHHNTKISELSSEKKVEYLRRLFDDIIYIQDIRLEDKKYRTSKATVLIDNQPIIRINIDENNVLIININDSVKKLYLKLVASLLLTIFLILFPLLLYQLLSYLRDLYYKEHDKNKAVRRTVSFVRHNLKVVRDLYRKEHDKNEAIWRTVSIVRHNIKEPLHIISFKLQILNERRELSSEIEEQIKIMLKSIDRANKILKTLDKPNYSDPVFEDVNIYSIIDKFIEIYKDIILKQTINISSKYIANRNINADSCMIEDLVQNLISNAIQAQIDGGYINIVVKNNRSHIILSIENSCSNSESIEEKYLCEPYYTTKVDGMGLGLYSVNEIVKCHNGDLKFKIYQNVFRIIVSLPIINK